MNTKLSEILLLLALASGCGDDGNRRRDADIIPNDTVSPDKWPADNVVADDSNHEGCPAEYISEKYHGQCLTDPNNDWGFEPYPIGVCNEDKTCCREIRERKDLIHGNSSDWQQIIGHLHESCSDGSLVIRESEPENDCFSISQQIPCQGGYLCEYCYRDFCIRAQLHEMAGPGTPGCEEGE